MRLKELDSSLAGFSFDESHIAQLRRNCTRNGIIGQSRAMSALRMGMAVEGRGYNIYVSGEDGTGRHSAVEQIASSMSLKARDAVCVYNFSKPQSPGIIVFDSPCGTAFCSLMDKVRKAFEENSVQSAVELLRNAVEGRKPAFGSGAGSGQAELFIAGVLNVLETGSATVQQLTVNLLADGSVLSSVPVVSESNLSSQSLFGCISGGTGYSHLDFVPGSVFSALGGFLVMEINQILAKEGLWEAIKLFASDSTFSVTGNQGEKNPTAHPVICSLPDRTFPVKIVLIGSEVLYDKLCETDEQFLRLFKVCAEFDFSMECSDENLSGTIAYILETARKNRLKKPVADSALCELLRCSCRYAEMRDELTAKLSFLGDLLLEADYFAQDEIDSQAVLRALEERSFANGITENRIRHEIEKGEMIISLEGCKTGVVNGLAVMDRGLSSFGTPAVISVSVAPGTEGIVNIEHEAGLSGEIHDKGLLILEGYLRQQYAKTFALSIYAGICFEQSYAEVDGDSASSSELFALLSAIGEIPVRQEIACTGSVNQMGDIQPVGGINEKITGFFDICSRMGLTGRQGVIIPHQNIRSLVLPSGIVRAVAEKKFHIYPISTIDEGMEILTLRESGKRNSKGVFPPDTLNRIIEDRLRRLCQKDK